MKLHRSFNFFVHLNLYIFCIDLLGSNISPNFQLSWPTPNPAFAKGMGYSAFLQKTGPDKDFTSGAFGCVRNNGYKFHEGLDLYPVRRDIKGRAQDSIYAAMDGIVSYVNHVSANSAYGKYMVLEHHKMKPRLYSLYGHLAEIDPKIKRGTEVKVAQEIGKMGNSASYRIPLDRSHLHFEIGLRLTDEFQKWYSSKKFSTPNRHGNYSGFNLVGLNPIPFYSKFAAKSYKSSFDYIKSLPAEAKIRVKTKKIPDFAKRYPSLCKFSGQGKIWNGWECIFGPYGLPTTLQQTDKCTANAPIIQIVSYDSGLQNRMCRKIVEKRNGILVPAEQMKIYIELLFGIKVG